MLRHFRKISQSLDKNLIKIVKNYEIILIDDSKDASGMLKKITK